MGSFRKSDHSARLQRTFTTNKSGLKPEQTGHSWQSIMYKLPLINTAAFLSILFMYLALRIAKRCSHSLISNILTRNLPSSVVTKIAINVILWFLKKAKLNRRFSSLIGKLAFKFLKRPVIRKACFQSNDVEICFLKLAIDCNVCLFKTGFIALWYWFISRLFWQFLPETNWTERFYESHNHYSTWRDVKILYEKRFCQKPIKTIIWPY